MKSKRRSKYEFDETTGTFNQKSKRYQTLRVQEKLEKQVKFERLFEEYSKQLNDEEYLNTLSEEALRVLKLKYKTILRTRKVQKREDELEIPFRIDGKTIIYIRESNVLKTKWVKLFGRDYINERVKSYKSIVRSQQT